MATWHQQQPIRRAHEAAGAFVHPWAHATEWQVIEDQPGRMATGCGRYATQAEANQVAAQAPGRYVINPFTRT